MAFLITSPLVNEVAVVLLSEALGWKFMFAYVGTGVGLGIIGGFIIDALKLNKWVEPYVWDIKMPTPQNADEAKGWSWREKYARGEAIDIIKRVWLYVLIGVGLGAGLHGYVPQEWFMEHAGADKAGFLGCDTHTAYPCVALRVSGRCRWCNAWCDNQ